MSNEQMILQNQMEMLKEITKVKVEVAVVREKVCGNGLEEVLKGIKLWVSTRPAVCPVVVRKSKRIIVAGVSIAAFVAVLEVIEHLITYFVTGGP